MGCSIVKRLKLSDEILFALGPVMNKLKIGDRVKITKLPDTSGSYLHPETKEVIEQIISRKRSVRISGIKDGYPYYVCRLKKNGISETHFISILPSDNNWALVK